MRRFVSPLLAARRTGFFRMLPFLLAAALFTGKCLSMPSSGLMPAGGRLERDVLVGHAYSFDLEDVLLPEFPTFPSLTYNILSIDNADFFQYGPEVDEGVLAFMVKSGLETGTRVTVIVEIEGDYLLTVLLTAMDAYIADVDISDLVIDKTVYDGEAVSPSGTVNVSLHGSPALPVRIAYIYTGRDGTTHPDPSVPPADAGHYRLIVEVEDTDYRGISEPLDFTIAKKPLTITPIGTAILAGEPLPDSYDCEFDGLAREEDRALFDPLILPEHTDTSVEGIIRLSVVNADALTHRNYEVSCADGAVTVQGSYVLTPEYYTIPEPGKYGWYNREITVTAAGLDGFHEIALSANGPFSANAILDEEGEGVQATLFLRRGAYVAQIPFLYHLDRTSPLLEVAYSAPTAVTGARLSVTASDGLSGIADITVTDPFGRVLYGVEGVYPADTEGSYIAIATDAAGNSAGLIHWVDLSADTSGWTESAGGLVLFDGIGNWSSGSNSSSGSGNAEADNDSRETADSAETPYWERVAEGLRNAADGSGISITPSRYQTVPAFVLDAFRGLNVTLRINTTNGSILLHGKDIPKPEQEFYTLAELAALITDNPVDLQEPTPQTAMAAEAAVTAEAQPPSAAIPPPVIISHTEQNSAYHASQGPSEALLRADAPPAPSAGWKQTLGWMVSILLGTAALIVTAIALLPVLRKQALDGDSAQKPPK